MNETICRLCLQTISNGNCQAISEALVKTLKLNRKISKETVMCVECANCLQVFSKFTPRCVYKVDRTLPLSDLENGNGLDTVKIETASNLESRMETETECSFCTDGREDVVSLNESKENKFMVNVLEQYISKMNLNSTEELLACGACLEALDGVLGVVLKCLEVEEKISEYIELNGTDDKGQIELKAVQLFMSNPGLKSKIESVGMSDLEGSCAQVKEEDTTMAELEVKYKMDISHPELVIKTDDEIKSEQSDCDITDTKLETSDCDGLQGPLIENNNPNDVSRILVVTSEMRKCKNGIKQHLLTHKNTRTPPKMFKCANCSYETIQKKYFNKHLLTHKSPSELKMFECELCPYATKHKGDLKKHSLAHKSPSELRMFKCELCPYESKHRNCLKQHLLTHKSPSELKMFKCELCPYETKFNGSLGRHLLTHKSPSEMKFKCGLCSYEAKLEGSLNRHLLFHKRPSELKFKCEYCSYNVTQESSFQEHLLTHESPSEVKRFKCGLRTYGAKRNARTNMHLLTHKSPS